MRTKLTCLAWSIAEAIIRGGSASVEFVAGARVYGRRWEARQEVEEFAPAVIADSYTE